MLIGISIILERMLKLNNSSIKYQLDNKNKNNIVQTM